MNSKRKMLSILPAFTILLAILLLLPITAKAATDGGDCGNNNSHVTWSYDDSSKTLTISGTGEMGYYSPWMSQGIDNEKIESVVIKEGVTSIGNGAFDTHSGLTNITIPNSVTSIGAYAFSDCGSLTNITIPNNLTSIGDGAFYGCESLTNITIPNGVTSIGNNAFNRCSSLTSIVVESGNKDYDSRNNCNAIIDTASKTLISGC